MIAVSGPAGSGKTTLANELAAKLLKPHVDLDDVTKSMLHAARIENATISEADLLSKLRVERYQQLALSTRSALIAHGTCITSAPFTTHLQQSLVWLNWLGEVAIPFHPTMVWLDLDPQVRLERLQKRASIRDATLLATAEILSLADTPIIEHIVVDAGAPLSIQVDQVLRLAL